MYGMGRMLGEKFRFIKLQDLLGSKIFKEILNSLGEYREEMSLLDVLDRLERLKIIESADQWLAYRKLRNQLAHEYPENREEIVEGIGLAIAIFQDISAILQRFEMMINKSP